MAKLMMVGAAAMLSFAMPATAFAQSSRHDDRHEQLDDVHGDVHEDLQDEHADAHDQGLNCWEHSQVHRNLQNRHEDADYALELEHQRRDMRSQWRRQYQGYGYQGYRYRGYDRPRYRQRNGFSIYLGN
jgi:hypothetical protein